ncbi:MAG: GTP 3',8-cyclase MoaA [Cyanobacteriota bacterium]|nr:GTP 3',8-cyclase MoaA [Cyanobacteriota bacterium]
MPSVNYLRVSLIDRCNFRCQYCMPDSDSIAWLAKQNLLTDPELLTLLQEVFIPLGIHHFRLTGGEPLLRPQLPRLIQAIRQLSGVEDLSLTTNGFDLAAQAQPLYDAGLRRINISLDSLHPDTFHQITGRDLWQKVWQGIQTAHRVGFDPLKLNVVVIPGVNDHEIEDLAALSLDRAWHIRFIEFMPIGNQPLFEDKGWVDSAQLRQRLQQRFGLTTGAVVGHGPADVFRIPGAAGTVGFISQMSECFCDRCNRMRLSADGWLRPCLLNETGQIDLKTQLRQGSPLADLREQVGQLLLIKPDINFKQRDSGTTGNPYRRTMSQIGG